jgi:hypothetical protein
MTTNSMVAGACSARWAGRASVDARADGAVDGDQARP